MLSEQRQQDQGEGNSNTWSPRQIARERERRGEGSVMSLLPAASHLEIKSFYAARDTLAFHDACTIRYNVFVAEQGSAADVEFDKVDETCVHLLAYYVSPACGGRSVPVGTLRLQPLANSAVARLGHVAVMKPHRHQGIASRLVSVAESVARSIGITRCLLHSQADKRAVYEKLGYRLMDVQQQQQQELHNGTQGGVDILDDIGIEDGRAQFLEDGVCHVKMFKDILHAA